MFKFSLILLALLVGVMTAQTQSIAVNQLGFYPSSYKMAVVPSSVSGSTFTVIDVANNQTVFTGNLTAAARWEPAAASYRLADFSSYTKSGTYYIKAGSETSYQFEISENIFEDPTQGLIRAFYYWRSSTAINTPYAIHKGTSYARGMGHPDASVAVASEAASSGRPSGTKFSCSRGWYDAGDYGKYVVSGSVAAYFLLSAYENNQAYLNTLGLNIPESSNTLPDILDEAKWEIDWFLEDIDPYDGGVYNRVTTSGFAGMSTMPADDTDQRYAYKKSTPSNLDYAAIMAVAYRIFKPFDNQLPGYADKCLTQALKAWNWARKNPNIAGNGSGGTGQYDDTGFNDEWAWAANELYIATKADSFYVATKFLDNSFIELEEPSWQKTSCLGLMSLVSNIDNLTTKADKKAITDKFVNFADSLCKFWDQSAFKVMTNRFWWGINSTVGAQGVIFAMAHRLTNNKRYLNAAVSQYDYLFGRNPLNQSYVTWYGDKSPLHPHDRRSNGDGVTLPQPGYVVGGANNDCGCTAAGPALRYHDEEGDYAVNEVAVNYSGPAVALSAYLTSAYKYVGARFVSAICTQPSSISVSLNAAIDALTINSKAFTLTVNGVTRTILSANAGSSAKTITLNLQKNIVPTDEIVLLLTDSSIKAADGYVLQPFSNQKVENLLPGAPLKLQSAVLATDGKTLTLSFDKSLASSVLTAPAGFSVLSNGYLVAIESLARGTDSKTLVIKLATAITSATEINVLFDGLSVIKAEDTGVLLAFGATTVKNNVTTATSKAKGFRDDCRDNSVSPVYQPASQTKLAESGEYLTATCTGQGGYNHLQLLVPAMDLTANPKFTMRFKTAQNFTLRVDLASLNSGTLIYTNSGTSTKSQDIKASSDFQTVSFTYTDWSGQYPVGTVDKTNVTVISLMFNAGGSFSGDVIIDYIAVGDAPLSSESHLKNLQAETYIISPRFDSSIYSYTVTVPIKTTVPPTISATALSSLSSTKITQAATFNDIASIEVTAEDGSKRKYSVSFIKEQPKAIQTISFKAGWNLFSTNVVAPEMSIASLFTGLDVIEIKTTTSYWRKSQAAEFNTLSTIVPGEGYLVKMNYDGILTISGDPCLEKIVIENISGWHLIGCPFQVETTFSSEFNSSNCFVVKNFEGFWIPNGTTNSIVNFEAGKGYFLNMK